jgi:hypothetical protein
MVSGVSLKWLIAFKMFAATAKVITEIVDQI